MRRTVPPCRPADGPGLQAGTGRCRQAGGHTDAGLRLRWRGGKGAGAPSQLHTQPSPAQLSPAQPDTDMSAEPSAAQHSTAQRTAAGEVDQPHAAREGEGAQARGAVCARGRQPPIGRPHPVGSHGVDCRGEGVWGRGAGDNGRGGQLAWEGWVCLPPLPAQLQQPPAKLSRCAAVPCRAVQRAGCACSALLCLTHSPRPVMTGVYAR